jgi:hypothetical protein
MTTAKRPGGVAEEVEYPPNKHEVLSSNHSIVTKKKKKELEGLMP